MVIDRNKLKWKCRRGVLELDTIFAAFYQQLDSLTVQEINSFAALLDEEDPLLLDWLVYKNSSPPRKYQKIIGKFILLSYNN